MTGTDLGPTEQRPNPCIVSVVAPAYNEEETILEFHKRLSAVFERLDCALEAVYVNDGSQDGTLEVLHTLRARDPRVAVVDLSRNFGKEIAMTAGLDHASGDAVVVIDADLQDPPELIPEMIRHWRAGYDVVYGQRTVREGETWLKKATAALFYRLIGKVGRVRIPEDTGDFRLLSRRAVEALRLLREHHRFMKGLFAWIGFPQKAVPYRRDPRFAGVTKWNYWGLWNLALEGITSFTTMPLRIATYIGVLVAVGASAYAVVIVYRALAFGESVQGYAALTIVVVFLGGLQLAGLGIIGEYLGRMFDEAKGRPLYLVKDFRQSEAVRARGSVREAKPPVSESVNVVREESRLHE